MRKKTPLRFSAPLGAGLLIMAIGVMVGFQFGKNSVTIPVVRNCEEMVVKNEVMTAVSLLSVMHNKYEQGELGMVQAKQISRDLVEGLYYGKNRSGKFIITDIDKATSSAGFFMDFPAFGWRVRTEGGL